MEQLAIAPVTPHGADWGHSRTIEQISLTSMQMRVLECVRRRQDVWGETPLYREIAAECGMVSPSTVSHHIRSLARLGLIRKPAGRVRAIIVRAVPVKPI